MKERAPALVAIGLLLGLVAGTWWAADYTQRAIPIDPPRRLTHEPDAWASHFVMLRTDAQGIAVNRLDGDHMVHYPDDDSYDVTQARAVSQRPDMPITIGTADTAVMDQDGSRITLQGNAHLRRVGDADNAPLDITSPSLVILPDDNLAHTDQPATVVHGRSIMHGTGMHYDNNARTLRVLQASDVTISAQDTQRNSRAPTAPSASDTHAQDTP